MRGLNKYVMSWGVETNASALLRVSDTSQGSKPDLRHTGNKSNKPFNFDIINTDKYDEEPKSGKHQDGFVDTININEYSQMNNVITDYKSNIPKHINGNKSQIKIKHNI